jgi:F-box protein 9
MADDGADSAETKQEAWLDSEWELTWPIWHMLPRDERKQIATLHGMHTIGEFEEYMTLQRAVHAEDSEQRSYANEEIYRSSSTQPSQQSSSLDEKLKSSSRKEDDEDDDRSDDDGDLEDRLEAERLAVTERLPTDELVKLGGCILLLPDEMLHRIFEWLPVDTYGILARVSPHWKSFTRTEAVYKRLCERLYLNQSKRRQLHVGRFNNSYRIMLEKRPRVRAGGGVYVMKYSRVKPIQRDMWTEVSL